MRMRVVAHRCSQTQIALGASELLEVGATICLRKLFCKADVGVPGSLFEALGVRVGFFLLLLFGFVKLIERDLDGLGKFNVVTGITVLILVGVDEALELLDKLLVHIRRGVGVEAGLDEQGRRLEQALELVADLLGDTLHGN